jgi:hypothetical protein
MPSTIRAAHNIRAGLIHEVTEDADWLIVDIGFAHTRKSCGVLINNRHTPNEPPDEAHEMTFGDCIETVRGHATSGEGSLNLLIEAPLSVAFDARGNPIRRSIEKHQDGRTRDWYHGAGATILIGTMHLLRAIVDAGSQREVRLFEGFVSFKDKGLSSDHAQDVRDLLAVIQRRGTGRVVSGEEIQADTDGEVQSAFAVAGMDFGVPPVILVGGNSFT